MTPLHTMVPLADARFEIGRYLGDLILVYILVIIAYILVSLAQSAGVRIPYNVVTGAVIKFLRDAAEPFLGFLRRFIPPLGPFDLSAVVGIILLNILRTLVVNIVQG